MTIYDHWLYRFLTGPLNNVAWLYILLPCVFAGGIYLTVGSGAVQFRRFGYAMKNTAGKLFKKQETAHGAITPLQAVTTALAATVGTGNIVGTSQAIAMGGYAGAFSVLAALAAFGIGNMSQANSIVGSVTDAVCAVNPDFSGQAALRWGLGIGLALLTALVLFGGIKRIGAVTEKLIPFMSVAYILMTLIVIFGNLGGVGRAFKAIFSAAFAPRAILGGAAGITIRQAVIWGLRRSAFSNEAGLGSAPIAHAAAHCDGPVEQGIYGIFEVFMDTIVICTLTALTIIISGVDVTFGVKPGSALITAAFGTVFNGTFSSVFIAVALTLFAYSTILGWSLYGSRCVQYLLGLRAAKVYQFIFIIMIVVGSVSSLDFVWNIADTLNGLMAIPNFIALFALSPVIFKITREYFRGVDLASAKHE